MLQLCLSSPGRERHVISIAQDASVHDLYEMARQVFGFPAAVNMELKHGFPPRVLHESTETTLECSRVVDKDRIQVVVLLLVEQHTERETKKQTATSSSSSSDAPERPQRAAAKAASDSFGDVIRAQDALQRSTAVSQKRKRHTAITSNSSSSNSSSAQPNRSHAKSTSTNRPRQPTTAGRRLADGAVVAAAAPPPPPRTTRTFHRNKSMKTEEDVSVALMGALLHKGAGGKVGQVLRGAMRNAISNSYEASRAVVKVSSVASHNYAIVERDGRLEVEYSKGLEGRGTFVETVDSIPQSALEAVVSAIHAFDRELLKAATLAQLSPRVFWSLFHIFPSSTSVPEALQSLVPNLDWSFLDTRKRSLSAKAMENKRQAQGESGNNGQAAQEVVNAVEEAMEQVSACDASRRRDRAARAAVARHDPPPGVWQLVTPTERDDDELLQCIIPIHDEATHAVERILPILHSMNIYNWRQLANATISVIAENVKLSEGEVESWVDAAQGQSVDEIMIEICDSRVDVVELLRDESRTGTPKDLANWRCVPEMLYDSAPSLRNMGVELHDVRTWCQRAQDVLNEWEWMHWYATPVE
jgi:hypothetical protein